MLTAPNPSAPEWRPVPNAPHYFVSDDGRVRVAARVNVGPSGRVIRRPAKTLLQTVNARKGYAMVAMRINGKQVKRSVHRLVLESFMGPCPDGCLTRHLNGTPGDNRLSNLMWGTPIENGADARCHGTTTTGERSASAKLTAAGVHEMREAYYSGRESFEMLAVRFGVGTRTASRAVTRKSWTHYHPLSITNQDRAPQDMKRRAAARRSPSVPRGERNTLSKLTNEDVYEIRSLSASGWSLAMIARRFPVTRANVGCIVRRDTWKHLPARVPHAPQGREV